MEKAWCGTSRSTAAEKHIPLPRRPAEQPRRSRPSERSMWKSASATAMSRVRQEAPGLRTP